MRRGEGSEELARLARSVGRMRRVGAACIALNLLALCAAWRTRSDVVEARRFVVLDEEGKVVAQLGKLDGVLVGLHVGAPSAGPSARLAVVPSAKAQGGAAALELRCGDLQAGARSDVSLASTSVGTHLGFGVERKSGATTEKASLGLTASQEEVAIRGKRLGESEGFKLPE